MFLCNNQVPKSHRGLTLSHQSTVALFRASMLQRVKSNEICTKSFFVLKMGLYLRIFLRPIVFVLRTIVSRIWPKNSQNLFFMKMATIL